MIRKNDYYKLGLFIIIGASMLISVIIILGAGRYSRPPTPLRPISTNRSTGWPWARRSSSVASRSARPVRNQLRTQHIQRQRDQEHALCIRECDINPELFDDISEEKFKIRVKGEVERGLRVRPTSLGLTGQLFLNIVYDDPLTSTPLTINWTPRYSYIPSAPSTLSQVEGAITTISKTLSSLKQEDLEAIISDVKSIVNTIAEFMKTEGGRTAGNKILDILEETRSILSRTDDILADPALETIIPNAAGAAESINTILTQSSDDLIAAAVVYGSGCRRWSGPTTKPGLPDWSARAWRAGCGGSCSTSPGRWCCSTAPRTWTCGPVPFATPPMPWVWKR